MSQPHLLQRFYHFEQTRAHEPYLTQAWQGQTHVFSWQEAGLCARRLARFLQSQDFAPGSRIGIYSKNSAYWVIADLAILMAGYVSVPIYPSLAGEGVKDILTHAEAVAVVVGHLDGINPHQGIPHGILKIATPLCREPLDALLWQDIQEAFTPITDNILPAHEALCTLIYTSGTTGTPKGVMHSFNTLSQASARWAAMNDLKPGDTVFSYLPLSHVGERLAVETGSIFLGLQIFFNESLETFIADLRQSRPDVFFAVPRIWLKLSQALRALMPEALAAALANQQPLSAEQQRQARSLVGLDRARYGISGAAPVPGNLLDFFQALGMPMIEIYGMSENFGYAHLGELNQTPRGWIGPANPEVCVKLGADQEVLLKSPGNMLGYFKDPELSARTLDQDGFLHTGDKGEINEQGLLRIIGRVRDSFKTSKGKFVAPGPIENTLAAHPLVEHVCVAGTGLSQPIALLILSPQAATVAPAQQQAALNELLRSTNSGLENHERLNALVILSDVWGIETGELTPTLKVKRPIIEARYQSLLEAAENAQGVIAAHTLFTH